MNVLGFPAPPKEPAKRLDEINWNMELGKPYGYINGSPGTNDLARYKDGSPAAKILHEAASLIDGERHKQHGDRHENLGTIAAYWTVLFGIDVQAWQVARAFELAKIARDVNGTANEDNARDAAAYSALSWELRGNGR